MPLTGNVKKDVEELIRTEPSQPRDKAIKTYAKKHNISYEDAKRKLAVIIALNVKS